MNKIDFRQVLSKLNNLKFPKDVFSKIVFPKITSLLVVDISNKLMVLSIDIKDEVRIDALKIYGIPKEKKDEVIINSIHDFIQENNIEHKNAILKPSLNSLLIKRIQLPAVPEVELADAIKWQIKEDISFDLSAAVIDFSVIKKTTKEDGSKVLDIMCAVAQEQEVKQQVILLKQAGLNCLSVAIESFGYEKNIERYLTQEKDEPCGILHLGEDICYFTIYKNNKLEFYRELPISINKLRDSLRDMSVSDKETVELSTEEANEILLSVGIPEKDFVYKEKISSSQILSILRPILERLIVEIKRSISYYDSEFNGMVVNKIFIAGPALKIPNIDKFLTDELALSVEKFSLKDKLTVSSSIKQESLSESYAALGLALDYRSNLNLLPYEFQTEKIEKLERISLRWITFVSSLLLIVFYLFAKAGVGAYQKRLDNTLLHLNVLSEVRDIKTKIDNLNNFILSVRRLEPPVGIILKKLSNITVKEIFFNKFSLDADSKTGEIFGVVRSVEQNPDSILTGFIRDMEKSGYFTDARITSVKKTKEQFMDIAEFRIIFKLP